MAKRRGHGEGSVYQRKDGYWVGAVDVGRYPNGKRRRARVVRRYKNGPNGVLAALDELKNDTREGVVPDRTKTVGTFLDFWLSEVIGPQVTEDGTGLAPGTYKEYRKRINRVKPHIGQVKLGKLTSAHVQALANQLVETYPRSPKTRSTTLDTLRQALRWAVASGLRGTNPAEHVSPPKSATIKVDDALTADEAKAILKAAEDHRLYALVWLALKYGLRIGELLNLRWDDIDFKKGDMTVRRSKTAAGVRTLPLIDDAKKVLQEHRKRQLVRPMDGYVFSNSGPRLKPQRVREEWSALLAKAKIKHLCRNCGVECTHGKPDERPCKDCRCSSSVRRFHVSRHTAATLLLEAGVPLEVVSAIMGHSNIGITADIYAKVRGDLKRKGLEKLA